MKHLQVVIFLWALTPVAFAINCRDLVQRVSDAYGSIFYEAVVATPRNKEIASQMSVQLQKEIEIALSRADHTAINYGVHELFMNAALWGNEFNPKKQIRVTIRMNHDKLTLTVSDEGTRPFDPLKDPNARREDEIGDGDDAFIARRQEAEREVTGGMGLNIAISMASEHGYHFDNGSHLILRYPLND